MSWSDGTTRYRPGNLVHVVFDNESLLSVGGFPTATSTGSDLAGIAAAAGVPRTCTVRTLEEFTAAFDAALTARELTTIVAKVDARTPAWKRPAWWWTRRFGGWPWTAEWLSAAFDYNVAPFFQSFVEVRVEPSSNRIRLWPYGVNGRLRWRDLAHSPLSSSLNDGEQAFVEWIVPMR